MAELPDGIDARVAYLVMLNGKEEAPLHEALTDIVQRRFLPEHTALSAAQRARLAHHGPAFAIGVALLLRLITHAYQGPVAMIAIVPAGAVLGWYFWSRQRLYPVVFAHALMDFVAFGANRA